VYQKTTKPEPELSDWDKGALAYAKTRLNDDGTIGAIVKKGPAADDWIAYFKWVGMRGRARFVKFHTETGGSCTFPTEFPHQYDPTFRVGRPAPKPAPKAEKPTKLDDRLRWWDK
jgi:hypothetical protein